MRLAFVNSAWPASWGGGEKWTVNAAEWFREQGHEVVVICRPVSKLLATAQGRDLPTEEFSFGGDFNPLASSKARHMLEHHRTELVVTNFNKESWQFGSAAKRLKIPLIARHGFPLLRNSIHHRHLLEKRITRLVVNAQAIRDEYAQLGLKMSTTEVIHNGVRIVPKNAGELRRRFHISPDEILILAAGRVESQKRFDRVIEIAADIVPQFPQAKFLIAGEGPDRETLEQQIQARGLADHVKFVGFVPDLAEIIGDADLFLLTSDQEGTPNVLLEAMAAGVPSIAFAVGSVPEIFAGELSSFAIEPGNTTTMQNRVRDILTDPAKLSRARELMSNRARTEFSLDHSMRQFERLFQATLSKSA